MGPTARKELPLFPISTVHKLTGLTPRQIRYYEQNGLLHPVRSEGKHRLFSLADVERLMQIRHLMNEGLKLGEVKEHFLGGDKRNETGVTDEQLYQRLQHELLEGQSSFLQGELSRFYRRKP